MAAYELELWQYADYTKGSFFPIDKWEKIANSGFSLTGELKLRLLALKAKSGVYTITAHTDRGSWMCTMRWDGTTISSPFEAASNPVNLTTWPPKKKSVTP